MTDLLLRDTVRTGLRSVLSSTDDVEGYLQVAVKTIGDLTRLDASYTVSTVLHGAPFTAATTDRDAWEADQVEFDAADGPCYELLHHDTTFGGIDLRQERRWPAWATVSNALGFRSAAAVGAELESGQRLVLNCYSVGDAFLDPDAVDRAQQFVDELAFTMPLALRLAQQASDLSQQAAHIAQLEEALVSRSLIDQALGVLMAQNRCTSAEAFAVLRRASQNRNVKLRHIATSIIERFSEHPANAPTPSRPASLEP